jgi:hypothetical protein
VNISKLLKNLFRSLMFFAVDGEGGGGASDADAPENDDDVMSRLSEIVGAGEDDDDAGAADPDAQPEPTEAEKQAAAQAAADKTFKLKVNGEERTYTEAELIVAAQKAEAAAQRFEEAANIRKQAEPELAAARQERQHLKQVLDIFVPQLQHMLQISAPDPQLINSDPQEYMRQNYAYQEQVGQLQQAQAAQAELTRREQFEQAQQLQVRAADEQQKLLVALPEWKDPAKAKDEASAVDGYLHNAGFSEQERNGIVDHRVIVVARKAMLYDQLMKQQAQATQRVEKLPPKVERPGNGVQPGDGRTRAMRNHAHNGSVESGAAAILQFLE